MQRNDSVLQNERGTYGSKAGANEDNGNDDDDEQKQQRMNKWKKNEN